MCGQQGCSGEVGERKKKRKKESNQNRATWPACSNDCADREAGCFLDRGRSLRKVQQMEKTIRELQVDQLAET